MLRITGRGALRPAPLTRPWRRPTSSTAVWIVPTGLKRRLLTVQSRRTQRFLTIPARPNDDSAAAGQHPVLVAGASQKTVHIAVAGCGPHFKRVYHRTMRKLMRDGECRVNIP